MKQFNITENDANQRLDKFLKKLFKNATRGLIYKFHRKGKIKVNDKKKKIDYMLQVGDTIKIYIVDSELETLMKGTAETQVFSRDSKLSRSDIIFEDDDILVVNKNAHQNVHPGDHKSDEVSLIEQVHDYYAGKKNSLTFKPSLVHRIDRDTTGIVIIAKTKKALSTLVSDFKTHKKIKKVYLAVLAGKLSRKSGTIKKPLTRLDTTSRQKVKIDENGKNAITHYKVLGESRVILPEGEKYFSLVELEIETGRMHQIRVHMQAMGAPIVGDERYSNASFTYFIQKTYNISRHMLHAYKIQFEHPITKKNMSLKAKPKLDMMNLLDTLRLSKYLKE